MKEKKVVSSMKLSHIFHDQSPHHHESGTWRESASAAPDQIEKELMAPKGNQGREGRQMEKEEHNVVDAADTVAIKDIVFNKCWLKGHKRKDYAAKAGMYLFGGVLQQGMTQDLGGRHGPSSTQ